MLDPMEPRFAWTIDSIYADPEYIRGLMAYEDSLEIDMKDAHPMNELYNPSNTNPGGIMSDYENRQQILREVEQQLYNLVPILTSLSSQMQQAALFLGPRNDKRRKNYKRLEDRLHSAAKEIRRLYEEVSAERESDK